MYRTHTCGELRPEHQGLTVTLAGWVQRKRELGGMTFVDLRDRYGLTQLVFDEHSPSEIRENLKKTGREYVIRTTGVVRERSNKNPYLPTGAIEIDVQSLKVLSPSAVPPLPLRMKVTAGMISG